MTTRNEVAATCDAVQSDAAAYQNDRTTGSGDWWRAQAAYWFARAAHSSLYSVTRALVPQAVANANESLIEAAKADARAKA